MSQFQHRTLSEIAAHLRSLIVSADDGGQYCLPQIDDPRFGALALELFAAQFEANPVYRRLCMARGSTPDSVSNWAGIPAMPAAGFKEFEVTCLPQGQRIAEFQSSGTTSLSPSRHFQSRESLDIYEASLWAWFQKHLVPNRALTTPRLAILTPGPEHAPHSSLVHMLESVRARMGAPSDVFLGKVTERGWCLDGSTVSRVEVLAQQAEAGATAVPVLLLGTAFSLLELVDAMAQRGAMVRLPAGSRVMETGGYKGRGRSVTQEQLHRLIHQHLGVPAWCVISEYGMSELSSQAYAANPGPVRVQTKAQPGQSSPSAARPGAGDKRANRVFHFPAWARARIVSPETAEEVAEGQTGLIQVYDLANVFSVIAIQTEDLGVKRGTGFELLGRVPAAAPKGCSLHVAAPAATAVQ